MLYRPSPRFIPAYPRYLRLVRVLPVDTRPVVVDGIEAVLLSIDQTGIIT